MDGEMSVEDAMLELASGEPLPHKLPDPEWFSVATVKYSWQKENSRVSY